MSGDQHVAWWGREAGPVPAPAAGWLWVWAALCPVGELRMESRVSSRKPCCGPRLCFSQGWLEQAAARCVWEMESCREEQESSYIMAPAAPKARGMSGRWG